MKNFFVVAALFSTALHAQSHRRPHTPPTPPKPPTTDPKPVTPLAPSPEQPVVTPPVAPPAAPPVAVEPPAPAPAPAPGPDMSLDTEHTWGDGDQAVIDALSKFNSRIDRPQPGSKWKEPYDFMTRFEALDEVVEKVQDVLCSDIRNKSVLLVGESPLLRSYIFARLAAKTDEAADLKQDPRPCNYRYDFEVDVDAIEGGAGEGNMYTGQVQAHWRDNILNPADHKPVVLYFNNLARLIGTGTHSHQAQGVETTFVTNIQAGSIKAVAYIDKGDYVELQSSPHASVARAFTDVINLPDLSEAQVAAILAHETEVKIPGQKLADDDADYITTAAAKYMPNRVEPDRSINSLDYLLAQMKKPKGDARLKKLGRDAFRIAVMRTAGVPEWLINDDWSVLKNLGAYLAKTVIGQTAIREDLVKLANIGYVAGRSENRPIGTTLFVGPTGIGKSFIARKLADGLQTRFITIDMTQYTDIFAESRFVDTISQNLISNPYAVYVFEEIDKADVKVLDKLYFLLDEGVFYDKNQKPLFAGGAFVILTTNAAEQDVLRNPNDPNLAEIVNATLSRMFRPSFLNRFDSVNIFLPFTDAEFQQLAETMARERSLEVRKDRQWNLSLDQAALNFVAVNGRSQKYGARPMKRLLDNVVEGGIAGYELANGRIPAGAGEVHIRLVDATQSRFSIEYNGTSFEYVVSVRVNAGE